MAREFRMELSKLHALLVDWHVDEETPREEAWGYASRFIDRAYREGARYVDDTDAIEVMRAECVRREVEAVMQNFDTIEDTLSTYVENEYARMSDDQVAVVFANMSDDEDDDEIDLERFPRGRCDGCGIGLTLDTDHDETACIAKAGER